MSTDELHALLRDIQKRCEKALSMRDKTVQDREYCRQVLANIALDTAQFVIS